MSDVRSKRLHPGLLLVLITLALVDFALLLHRLMRGHNVALFNPQGPIASQQHNLMMRVVGILLIVAVPTLFLLYITAWKYRESNTQAEYDPNSHRKKLFKIGVWLIPGTFLVLLASIMWPATHKLAPQKAISSDAKPLTIQVITLRWKWLLLYPEQGIATVNFAQLPVNTPVQFEMTADEAPMSSFWIPNLGGQLYTMTGHVNRLNLMATSPGDYPGRSAEINGAGFSGMQLTARASSLDAFNEWVENVKQSPAILDEPTYNNLLKPSQNNPATFYAEYDHGLYTKVVAKYTGLNGGHTHAE